MLKNISLRTKLLGLCAFLSTMTIIIGAISYQTSRRTSALYEHVAKVNLASTDILSGMRGAFKELRIHLRTIGITGISPAQTQEALQLTKVWTEKFEKLDDAYNDVQFIPGEKELYEQVKTTWVAFKAVEEDIFRAMASGTPADLEKVRGIFFKECPEGAEAFEKAINRLIDFQKQESKKWVAEASSASDYGNGLILAISVVAITLDLIFGFLFSRNLSRTLSLLADRLRHGASELAMASEKISDSGNELLSSTHEQASALEQTAASLHEASAMITESAEKSTRSKQVAISSQEAAQQGKKAVDDMVSSIEDINRSNTHIMAQIEESHKEIANIVQVIGEISNKTKVINDIVFQTKLLSFNASVEAARAGVHGKDFAVVAEEVGSLAQMSGNAAKEIAQMLDSSIQQVEKTVQATKSQVESAMEMGRQKVEFGIQTSSRCGKALDEIVSNISEMTQMVEGIAVASQEQATGIEEINKAMAQLNVITKDNTIAAQQSATATSQLNEQSTTLRQVVYELSATVSGNRKETSILSSQLGLASEEENSQVISLPQVESRKAF